MKQTIFVVEDDKSIMGLYEMALDDAGYEFAGFECAEDMFARLSNQRCDLIILDIMLPGMSGLQALAELKNNDKYKDIPVIMASAKDDEQNKVSGLDAGADDYIAKPFGMKELIARIKANLRKFAVTTKEKDENILEYGDILINDKEHEVYVKGEHVALTLKEYNLLHLLMENIDNVVKREKILSVVWDYDYVGETRTLDMHIKSLRSKLGEKTEKQYISTIRGVGYKFSKL